MKQLNISFLLFVLMSMISNSALAVDYDLEVDGNYYKLISTSEKTVEFVGTTKTGDLIIPEQIIVSNRELTVISVSAPYLDVTSVTIPNSVDNVQLFGGSFKTVLLPPDLDHISSSAFSGCKNLREIDLPDNVNYIDTYAFSGCSNLGRITLPQNLECIEYYAFANCSNLHKIVIPSKVRRIGGNSSHGNYDSTSEDGYKNAFYGFDNILDTLIIEGSNNNKYLWFNGRNIPGGPGTWGYKVDSEFGHQTNLNYLYIGKQFDYSYFTPKVGLTSKMVVYGDTYQGDGEDRVMASEIIVLGKQQTAIKRDYSNTNLQQVYVRSMSPTRATAFSNWTYINGTLFVPRGSLEAYSQANVWKEFWNIEEYDVETGIADVYEDTNISTNVYGINGMHQSALNKGLNIIKHRNGKVEKIWVK